MKGGRGKREEERGKREEVVGQCVCVWCRIVIVVSWDLLVLTWLTDRCADLVALYNRAL